MDPYIVGLVGTGVLILLVAWLPMLLRELPLSLPMFCVMAGLAIFGLTPLRGFHPMQYPEITERLTELVVLVALTGAGERTRYERELLGARRSAERSEAHVRLLQSTTAPLTRTVIGRLAVVPLAKRTARVAVTARGTVTSHST